MKKRVLVFVDYYEPGFKAGGPIRTLKNILAALKNDFDFFIVTRNHDIADNNSYLLEEEQWIKKDGVTIQYLAEKTLTEKKLNEILDEVNPTSIYLNSFCSLHFSIKLLFWLRNNSIKKIIAPRGEFSLAALKIKWLRKWSFIKLVNCLNWYNNIVFHASSEFEKKDILLQIKNKEVIVIPDLVTASQLDKKVHYRKEENKLKLCFLGRISPVKNLECCIESIAIANLPEISLDIYGPIEDESYFNKCSDNILQKNLTAQIHYKGLLNVQNVHQVLKQYDFLFFPSKSENFGHVIFESIAVGTPTLISKHTFWNKFEHSAHWCYYLTIEDTNSVANTLKNCLEMKNDNYLKMSMNAFRLAEEIAMNSNEIDAMKTLFS